MLRRAMLRLAINLIPVRKRRRELRDRFFTKRNTIDITADTRCLMICPHPDDEMLGAGGVLVKYAAHFDVCCISSAGVACKDIGAEQRADIRITEFHRVMDALGVKNRWIFKTFGVPPFIEQIDGMFRDYCAVLDFSKYDYIFLPHPRDSHPEHLYITNVLVKRLLRKQGYNPNTTIAFYEVWTPHQFPNYYEDISDVAAEKRRILGLYESQWVKYNLIPRMMGLNAYRGFHADNAEYAEAFELIPVKKYLRKGQL